jgi:hypothetical protein
MSSLLLSHVAILQHIVFYAMQVGKKNTIFCLTSTILNTHSYPLDKAEVWIYN